MTPSRNDHSPPQRILALWFPYLPSERLHRLRYGRCWRSAMPKDSPVLVLSRRQDNTQRIAALEARADGSKLVRGMGIAEARAIHPEIEVLEADPAADRRLLEGLADWCDRYTPLVAIDGEDGLFLDITGCAHLFGGERRLLDDLLARLFEQGFETRAGLASAPGTAWATARYGRSPCLVAAGAEVEAVAPLPLAALRIGTATRDGLASVGLRTVGAILDKPRAPLARRFGSGLMLRLDQALGRVEEPVSPRLPVPTLSAERIFAEPIGLMEDVETLVEALGRQLRHDLERRGEGALALGLGLFRVDGKVTRIRIGSSRPLRDPASMRRLFRDRLAATDCEFDAGYGFDLVRLSVLAAAPFDSVQADLHGASGDATSDLALFADRVRARLGEAAIAQPRMVESHWPERAARLEPLGRTVAENAAEPKARLSERPLRLFAPPECVEVSAAEVPEGPPLRFSWRRVSYRVARAEGPERIAPEWWHDEEGATRDYFRVEDEQGRRFWLFREGLYGTAGAPPRWYLQGLFA